MNFDFNGNYIQNIPTPENVSAVYSSEKYLIFNSQEKDTSTLLKSTTIFFLDPYSLDTVLAYSEADLANRHGCLITPTEAKRSNYILKLYHKFIDAKYLEMKKMLEEE